MVSKERHKLNKWSEVINEPGVVMDFNGARRSKK